MLQIFRSSRIERLAALLSTQLHRYRPASVLTPQTLIVGHLGMKRWLSQHLAEQQLPGLPRIAANLEMLLPSEWLDLLAQSTLGTEAIAIAPYRRPALRWRIYTLLPQLGQREIERYLAADDASPKRRFQLADRLAGLYGQYLVYRRDWLQAWEQRRRFEVDGHWQGELWRQLVADIGLPHRGQRMGELEQRLATLTADAEQPALHVFGVSHLPPDALHALQHLSATRTVCVYFPDPCRELWDDLRSRRELYRQTLQGAAYLSIGHPLLAALGRLGQHFTLMLNGLDALRDERDVADVEPDGHLVTASLLHRVQHSVRSLRPDWARAAPAASVPARDLRDDASLRVHLCHTRLRELEVLKDALLDRLRADPGLLPQQIVVMAPNMALYAPLLPVVFGEPGRIDSALPYHLADVALVRSHPLLGAFRELLDLPQQRITRTQVLSLLALPAVSRRLQLGDSQHQALQRWLARCHVAWGLDGAMKAEFGAADIDDNSFAFGLDRMHAGHLIGHEDRDWLFDEAILPADPVHGPDAEALGALNRVLEILREWRAASGMTRPASLWSAQLQTWLAQLFEADFEDADECQALTALHKLVAAFERECAAAGVDPRIDWAVVSDVLKQGLDGIPERQAFLAGGITFCGMVPQRAIPFQVIALLGLNDGDYPRTRPDTGLDLMQSFPRLGDRDNRVDDRYLFLEALMSARHYLHLSYVGEGVQDGKPRMPAAPLADLLGFLDEVHGYDSASDADRPWCVRHPLQPFDARYFAADAHADPRLFSYSSAFAGVQRDERLDGSWQFLPDLPPAHGEHSAQIDFKSLQRFFAAPGEWLCQNRLRLSREALQRSDNGDQEALSSTLEQDDYTHSELLNEALRLGHSTLPLAMPAHLARSGAYAAGALGSASYAELRARATQLLAYARALPPFAAGPARAEALDLGLIIDGVRIDGALDGVFRAADSLWLVSIGASANISFRQLLPLYLRWALLRLLRPDVAAQVALIYPSKDTSMPVAFPSGSAGPIGAGLHAWVEQFPTDPARLRDGLRQLIALYQDAVRTAGVYFPRTSFSYADTLREARNRAPEVYERAVYRAREVWRGGRFAYGERDYAPGYNQLLAPNEAFLRPGAAQHRRFGQIAETLLALLQRRELAP